MQARGIQIGQGNFLRAAMKCVHHPMLMKGICSEVEINEVDNFKMPEEPTTCCMSGCANCVWIEYAEKLSKLLGAEGPQKAKEIILNRVADPNIRTYLLMELKILENRLS